MNSPYEIPCSVTADLNRHLTKIDEGEDQIEAIYRRMRELMAPGGECDPLDPDRFSDALCDIDPLLLVGAIKAGNFTEAGRTLGVLVTAHWYGIAESIAEREFYVR